MFTDQEVAARLHFGEMEEWELQHILTSHFRGAGSTHPDVVTFPGLGGPNEIAIAFKFKKGKLASVHARPALKDEDLAELQSTVESELLPADPIVGTQVLFSDLPVAGTFRFGDVFQIFPVPAEAPQAPVQYAKHPFLIQWRYKPSLNGFIAGSRRVAQALAVQLLLSVLIEGHVRGARSTEFHWVIPSFNPDELPKVPLRSTYCQEMYTFQELGRYPINTFAETSGIEPMCRIDPVLYYTRVGIQVPQFLAIPTNLEELLDRFFAASDDDQDRFSRACYWFSHVRSVIFQSRSAAFLALISAIEALMPAPEKIAECQTCRRPISKGATRRMNEFLDQYTPANPEFQKGRVALYYEFRSQLTHGGALAHVDGAPFRSTLGGKTMEEQDLLDEIWHLVRILLINWLDSRRPLLIPTKNRGRGLLAFQLSQQYRGEKVAGANGRQ